MTELPTATGIPAPPYDDGEPEFVPRPRRRARALTYVLAGALVAGAGFLGGVLLQKHEDKGTSTNASLAAISARLGGTRGTGAGGTGTGTRGNGGGSGFGGGAGAVVGTVKLVDGSNVYVTEASGNIVKVTTSAGTQISKTDPTTTRGLTPNETVVVRGTTESNGDVAAAAVVASPAGSGGLFGGAGGGGTGG